MLYGDKTASLPSQIYFEVDQRIVPKFLEIVTQVGDNLAMICFEHFFIKEPLMGDLFGSNTKGSYIRCAYANLDGSLSGS